ncbi:hypothetical protein M011DRAFT_472250 [Sporormia fimetaria CBS 119925]|uniref:Aminoglycoside phosphotransferase domain-containing protein n=1 Tax=Sporormia fimetaria CBS 119925 TaxID=1340428 RepID=A0A6A6UXG0_9PLEO|nr:hypothetical protein M011DRAFT_472250 [Sporormia fimetaria CBS 119925]
MTAAPTPEDVASSLLARHGLQLQSIKSLQSLWAGYGHICRVVAVPMKPTQKASNFASAPSQQSSFVIKLIAPPPAESDDEGHLRKLFSYQVEQYFYTHLAPSMPSDVPVAQCHGSINEHHADGTLTSAMLLTDLRTEFPVAGEKRAVLSSVQAYAALDWLATFHGFWLLRASDFDRSSLIRPPLDEARIRNANAPKPAVWLNGGYTYLATRRSEYGRLMEDLNSEWRDPLTKQMHNGLSLAESAARILAPTVAGDGPSDDYQTLIHGDVKSENLFTNAADDNVVFYDFQYTGLGLGVCDLAKFFTCSVPLDMLVHSRITHELKMEDGEKMLLNRYLDRMVEVSGKSYDWDLFVRHWETALVDWLRFQASWGFWGNTDWLEARVRSILKDEAWLEFVGGEDAVAARRVNAALVP